MILVFRHDPLGHPGCAARIQENHVIAVALDVELGAVTVIGDCVEIFGK